MKRKFLFAFAVLCVMFCHAETNSIARNVILMIGDGMGMTHVRLAADAANRPLVMQTLSVTGSLTTVSANDAITDSAAAGTALASGKKINNGHLGVLPDGTPLQSIATLARMHGKRIGIVSSDYLNGATPAAFYACVNARSADYLIGKQAFASGFDILAGRGMTGAMPPAENGVAQKTLFDIAEQSGYTLLRTSDEIHAAFPESGKMLILPNSLYSEAGISYGRPYSDAADITLAQIAEVALRLLQGDTGFFLMVEGGFIDKVAHANDIASTLGEVRAFDEAVAVAKRFVQDNLDTLLIVTSDHETGGLMCLEEYVAEDFRRNCVRQQMSYGDLRNALRKLAENPVDDEDAGWTEASALIASAFRFDEAECRQFDVLYHRMARADEKDDLLNRLIQAIATYKDKKLGIAWTTGGHTATPVPLWAEGPGANRLQGAHDNTELFRVMLEAFAFPPEIP